MHSQQLKLYFQAIEAVCVKCERVMGLLHAAAPTTIQQLCHGLDSLTVHPRCQHWLHRLMLITTMHNWSCIIQLAYNGDMYLKLCIKVKIFSYSGWIFISWPSFENKPLTILSHFLFSGVIKLVIYIFIAILITIKILYLFRGNGWASSPTPLTFPVQ